MEKIGVLGGTFDPVHNEHLSMAEQVKRELSLDRLIVVPTFSPPHKSHSECAPPQDRLNMLSIAFGGAAEICDYEIREGGTSYTYKTLEYLKGVLPESELFFIVGGDMLSDFKTWKFPERILAAAKLAAFGREGAYTDFAAEKRYFLQRFGREFIGLEYCGRQVSSTKIRLYKMFSLPYREFVPAAVADYMEAHALYPPTPAVKLVKSVLKEKRFRHTAEVAACALDKAKALGIDRDKAFDACAYHDIAKYLSPESYPAADLPNDLPEPVVHAFLGAYVLENVYGVEDKDILNAVRYHTTGRAGMSPLEKLVFTADMVEESRTFPGVNELRALFENDFEACFRACVKRTYEHLVREGKTPYRLTAEAYEYYKEEKTQ